MNLTNEKAQYGNNAQTITTLEIAEMMETEHSKILRKLEGDETHKGIISVMSEAYLGVAEYFQESTYLDARGKPRKCYNVTKLECDFLANKFTGEKEYCLIRNMLNGLMKWKSRLRETLYL